MKLKLDDKGAAVLSDGKPVYIADDGKEIAFDAPGTVATIGRLNGEAKSHRERAEAAEAKLKGFDGIEDPVKARKALDIVANLDQKKLVDAGEKDKAIAEAIKAVEEKYAPIVKKNEVLEQEIYAEKIGGGFARSKFIGEKMILTPSVALSHFGKYIKVEEGKMVGYDANGARIYSKARPGELADLDEALETLVEQSPDRDRLLKSPGSSGGGASGAAGNGGAGGAKTVKRAAWDVMPQDQRAAHVKAGGTVVE